MEVSGMLKKGFSGMKGKKISNTNLDSSNAHEKIHNMYLGVMLLRGKNWLTIRSQRRAWKERITD